MDYIDMVKNQKMLINSILVFFE